MISNKVITVSVVIIIITVIGGTYFLTFHRQRPGPQGQDQSLVSRTPFPSIPADININDNLDQALNDLDLIFNDGTD